MSLKRIFKETIDNDDDSHSFINRIAAFDNKTSQEVSAAKYYKTNYLPFAIAAFSYTYNYIGVRLKLDAEYIPIFWKRYVTAQIHLQKIAHRYDKKQLANQICMLLKKVIKPGFILDPIQFVNSVHQLAGNPLTINNFKVNKIKKAGRKQTIHPTKCKFCSLNKCRYSHHKKYWEKVNSKEPKMN